MSLQVKPRSTVPEETVRVARAAFPKGNPYLTLRDELETIYVDSLFAALFPSFFWATIFKTPPPSKCCA